MIRRGSRGWLEIHSYRVGVLGRRISRMRDLVHEVMCGFPGVTGEISLSVVRSLHKILPTLSLKSFIMGNNRCVHIIPQIIDTRNNNNCLVNNNNSIAKHLPYSGTSRPSSKENCCRWVEQVLRKPLLAS